MKLPIVLCHLTRFSINLIVFLPLLLAGCGGGGDGGNTSNIVASCSSGDIALETPTTACLWGTDAATIDLGGWARTPGDQSNIANCSSDPGYTMLLTNETTGVSVPAGAWSGVTYSMFWSYCDTKWGANNVPLALDSNHITVKAWRAGALVGEDSIDVRRMPAAAGSWQATSTSNAPAARQSHTAVWTGSQMVVWGGYDGSSYLATGGRYDPVTDTWSATSTINAPVARYGHTAVWTGSEMIVWGGWDGIGYIATGGRYNPATDTWRTISTAGAPNARAFHTAVWTGSEMIVWGGRDASGVSGTNTGSRYNPSTNTWSAISAPNTPELRYNHTAVWTGSQMIVWGGANIQYSSYWILATGGRYDPSMNRWTPTWSAGLPTGSDADTAVWTGSTMIIWDGSSGSSYNPATDGWTATTTTGAPVARYHHSAVWTGSEMIVWGGYGGGILNSGGRYTP